MTFQRKLLTLMGVLFGLALLGVAPSARAADEATYTIAPSATDPAITEPPPPSPSRGNNLVWLAPEHRRVGKLLVFLPTGGATNFPSEFTELGSVAGKLGYHTIILAYRNEAPVAALPTANPPGCGPAEAQPANTCARDARWEILTGEQVSSVVNVNEANSIENRLNKLLVYLKDNMPAADGWAQFLTSGPNPEPVWSETVIAGSSLGAGEALMIAQDHDVYRAALLHGWVDAAYDWVTQKTSVTPSEDYFTLIHQRDNFFGRTCFAYKALGLTASCPLPGFQVAPAGSCTPTSLPLPNNPLWVENLGDPPFTGLQVHVFNLNPGSYDLMGDYCHQSTSRNGWIARDGTAPSQILVNAWSSVLGDETDGDGIRNLPDNCPSIANPGQADADIDGIGDVCDKDRDGDTILNATDNCPDSANAGQADADSDGIGDACDPTPYGTIAPTIAVPAHITVNATGPAGATVLYTVTATDDLQPAPSPVCTPAAGSQFMIGTTPVGCTATDAGGNTAAASFTVTVLGAKEQLAILIGQVVGATNLPAAVKTSLTASLQSLLATLDPSQPLQHAAACLTLRAFITLVPYLAPPAQAAAWTADASRIRAVLAC